MYEFKDICRFSVNQLNDCPFVTDCTTENEPKMLEKLKKKCNKECNMFMILNKRCYSYNEYMRGKC